MKVSMTMPVIMVVMMMFVLLTAFPAVGNPAGQVLFYDVVGTAGTSTDHLNTV